MKKGALFTAIAYVGVWLLVGAYWLCGQTTESPLWIVIATLCMMMPLIATVILQRIEKGPVLRGLESCTSLTVAFFHRQSDCARNTDINGIERMTQTIIYILICINVVTFLVYGIDKWKAKQGSWRISEASLLLLAVIGGSIGALLGMQVWHHKTKHKGGTHDVDNIVGGYQFKYGLPLIVLAQVALIYLINQNLR